MLMTSTAHAQRLNFDGAGVFQTGSERSVTELSRVLRAEATARVGKPAAITPAVRAQQRVREFAATLLDAGSSFAEEGSVHVMVARRIAAQRAEVDLAIEKLGASTAGVAVLDQFLVVCPIDAAAVPKRPAALDQMLATVFGPLVRNIATSGATAKDVWPIERLRPGYAAQAEYESALEQLAEADRVSAECIVALRAYGARLRERETPGTKELSAANRQLLVQAMSAVMSPPSWASDLATASLGNILDDAAKRLMQEGSEIAAKADLARIGLIGDVMNRAGEIRMNARQTKAMRALTIALAIEIKAGVQDSDDVICALRKGFVLLSEYEAVGWDDNRRVVRELRPLWRERELQGKRTRDALIDALLRLTPTSAALSDPAVLGGLNAMSEVMTDVNRMHIISAWLAGADAPANEVKDRAAQIDNAVQKGRRVEPAVKRDDRVRKQAGIRLLALAPKMKSELTQHEAIESFRALADGLISWHPIPFEEGLRAASSSPKSAIGKRWLELTGNAASAMTATLDAARAEWLTEWSGLKVVGPRPAVDKTPAATRLDLLRELIEIGGNITRATDMSNGDPRTGMRAWPGFELSTGAIEAMLTPLRAGMTLVADMVAAGDYDGAEKAMVNMRGHAKVVSTLVRLEDAAIARNLARHHIFEELATPLPVLPTLGENLAPATWLGNVRESIASMSRALEEYAEATRNGSREQMTAIQRFVVAECERVRRELAFR